MTTCTGGPKIGTFLRNCHPPKRLENQRKSRTAKITITSTSEIARMNRSPGIEATVVSSSFLGSLRRTTLRLTDNALLSVQHEVEARFAPGEVVHIKLKGAPVSAVPRT